MPFNPSYADDLTTRRPPREEAPIEWGPAADAPTYLPKDEVIEVRPARFARSDSAPHARPTLRKVQSDSVVTSAPRVAPVNPSTEPASRPERLPEPPSAPRRKSKDKARHSAVASGSITSTPSHPSQPRASSQPAPRASSQPAPRASSQPAARASSQPAPRASSQPAQPAQPSEASQPSRPSQPSQPRPSQPELPGGGAPFVQFPNGGAAFDPLALPLPPDLAPAIYGWLRRLALQAELPAGDRLLRDALADLTSSLSVVIIYAGPEGFYTLGADDELPKDTQPLTAVGKARRALVSTHSALVPIVTPHETIAVIQLQRNARQPAFGPADYVAMAAIGRESASVMHHLVVEHLQHKNEIAADKGSLYRHEALESHRKRGTEGVIADMSPKWVRRAYPLLVITILVAVAFAALVKVPTWSSGKGVIAYPGTMVTAAGPGIVVKLHVKIGDSVQKGQPLVKLSSQKEDADLMQATSEAENAERQYLFDPTDDPARKALASALATKRRAEQAVDEKIQRAPVSGTVVEIPTDLQKTVNFGDPLVEIANPGAKPVVKCILPGNDKPRLQKVKSLQVELKGYSKGRDTAAVVDVDPSVTGPDAVRRTLGVEHADAIQLTPGQNYTIVKAELPSAQFTYHHEQLPYSSGMEVACEAKLESKPFISTLLPDLDNVHSE